MNKAPLIALPHSKLGFSLVELSIVLVILGLLVGGVLSGQSLIRASELRSISSEYQRYSTSVHTFRDKYFALPGDMANATSFWGAEPLANCPGDQTTPSTTIATCNGNGNGQILWSGAAGFGGESHRFWQQLANAGLIEGRYTGTHSAGGCNGDGQCNITAGVNAPASKLSKAVWSNVYNGDIAAGNPNHFAGSYGNVFFFGTIANFPSNPAISASEAWNVDTKIDDGKPGTGRLRSWNNTFHTNCASSDTPDSATYQVATSGNACALIFSMGI